MNVKAKCQLRSLLFFSIYHGHLCFQLKYGDCYPVRVGITQILSVYVIPNAMCHVVHSFQNYLGDDSPLVIFV